LGLLADQLERVLRRPGPAIASLVVGLLLGLVVGRVLVRDATALPATKSRTPAATDLAARGDEKARPDQQQEERSLPPVEAEPAERRDDADRRAVERAIERGRHAAAVYGETQVAVMMDTWDRAVTVPASPSRFRVWSVSKVFTAVTLLSVVGEPDQKTAADLTGALQRSENCPQRSLVLALQHAVGGIDGAEAHLQNVLGRASASVDLGAAAPAEAGECVGRLPQEERTEPALRLGTSEWSVTSAARFMYALRRGHYGGAGETVLRYMRAPKSNSREAPGQYTAPPNWGAGAVFGAGTPYKAGWGGSNDGAFVAEQIAAVDLGHDRWAAIAVAYHPSQQPPTDDPGAAQATEALAAVLAPIKSSLQEVAR
jgi:hypothetical protein